MKKWKVLLGAIGIVAPLVVATPFVVSCANKKEYVDEKNEIITPTKFITFETYWEEFNYWDREIYFYVKIYRDETDYKSSFNTFQIGKKDKVTKEWVWLSNSAIYDVKEYYKLALENGYTPITMFN